MSLLQRKNIQFTGQKRSALDMARGRIAILGLFFIIAYITVAARVVDLSIIQGDLKKEDEQTSYLEKKDDVKIEKTRADIVDRNGIILARSLKTASLFADPYHVVDAPSLAKDIVKIFPDLSYGDTLKKLQSSKRFVWIKRNITPEEQHKILYLGNPALSFEEEQRRIYPLGSLTSHVVGYTGVDGRGLGGLEAGFDKLLSQSDTPLTLSIDSRIQHALRRETYNAMKKFHGIGGAGMVMDINTGEVIAAVSLPDFDPQKVSSKITDQDKKALFNNLTLGVFEPGSTFKIFTTAAGIEIGNIGMDKTFDATEPIVGRGYRINDFQGQKRILTVPEIFMHSSNIGSVKIAQMIGTEELKNFLKDIGLFQKPEIEIPEVGTPLLPKRWTDIDAMAVSYGHSIAVSPFQLVSASSSIMNGGMLIKPTFVLNKDDDKASRNIRVVSDITSHRMKQLMRLVVTGGTGANSDVPGYNVGGKTGTAEKNSAGGYDVDKRRSSFLAFFPIENPKYAVYVMVDEPKSIKESHGYATAGWVAAPAVKKIIESIVSIEGIRPQDSDELGHTLDAYVKTKEQIAKEKQLASYKPH